MREKVLVTGANGFIGKHVMRALEEANYETLSVTHDNLTNKDLLTRLVTELSPDYIIHLAAYGNMIDQTDEQEIFNGNILSTWNLLQASKEINYKGFINVSSSSVTLANTTFYSASKTASEALCHAFIDTYKLPIVTVRPYSVYGQEEADFRFIPTVFRSCIDEEPMKLAPFPVHDWVHVSDVVKSIISCMTNAKTLKGEVINAATGIGHTNQEVVELIEKITGKKANITEMLEQRPFDTDTWIADTFTYLSLPLKKGLQQYYTWYTKSE